MTRPTLLVVAKAPVPGLAKTRIAAQVGDDVAAELAAAALLDTLETVQAAGAELGAPVVVAITGDVAAAARSAEIAAVLATVDVVQQRGDGFAERLVHAHADADRGHGVVQVGMDTPQLTTDDYADAVRAVIRGERVVGPADDGGWWLLGLPDAAEARVLASVPMSAPDTGERTVAALSPITSLRTVLDMDEWADAQHIAAAAPSSRLAAVVQALAERVTS